MRAPLVIPCLAAFLALPAAARHQPCPPDEPCRSNPYCQGEEQDPDVCEIYRGPLSFKSAEGLVQGCVVIQQWQIANQVTAKIPHQGLLIVHLRAGELVSQIGDEQTEWGVGSFWSVPADWSLMVRTARDSVVLQTVDFIVQQPAAEEACEPRRLGEPPPP